jgi:putative ABC transport system permease protein
VSFLALVALVIATTGLVAMATLLTGRRRREIAVRKVHGARTGQIIAMLLARFTTPVLMANLFAWPVGYIAGRAYLDLFVYSVPLTLLPFLLCLTITGAIACIAVSGQVLRAAGARPADMLRTE